VCMYIYKYVYVCTGYCILLRDFTRDSERIVTTAAARIGRQARERKRKGRDKQKKEWVRARRTSGRTRESGREGEKERAREREGDSASV